MSVKLFKSLLYKSTQIQREIDREASRSGPDRVRLLKLKKISLSIRHRLARVIEAHQLAFAGPQLKLQPVRIRHR